MAVNEEKSVFTINDVDLLIPPEAMDFQKEDLVYNWRVLRSKSSTKIPSGHGQILGQMRIPFKDSDILALHRLIIEFRHSPFCYAENSWLRSTLCPEWPLSQKMAFTMTGLDIVPYPGTSDAWLLNLELSWFNYIPYVHNWLYRRDWTTDWISSTKGKGEPYYIKSTIGWNTNQFGDRISQRLNIVDERSSLINSQTFHQEWSALQDSYVGKALTIEDFELLHRGEIFDLLPMPGMMERAFFVPQPSQSLIYKRYINFLQRDALLRNFGIDLDSRVDYAGEGTATSELYRLLFNVYRVVSDNGHEDFVQPLHESLLPLAVAASSQYVQPDWTDLHSELTSKILEFKQGVNFAFATYKSVQLPNNIAEATQSIIKQAKAAVAPSSQSNTTDTDPWVYASDRSSKVMVRRGLSEPLNFHTPIGELSTSSLTGSSKRSFKVLTEQSPDFLRYRSKQEVSNIYGREEKTGRYHWGSDITTYRKEGLPVYAVKDGTVTVVNNGSSSGSINHWRALELQADGSWKRIESINSSKELLDDWIDTTNTRLGGKYKSADVGTVLSSNGNSNRLFYVDFTDAGRSVSISHNGDRERSKYLHLKEVYVNVGQTVYSGDLIGLSGSTSRLKADEVAAQVTSYDGGIQDQDEPIDLDSLASEITPHLHFEYWERRDWHSERNPKANDQVPEMRPPRQTDYVAVDVRPTFYFGDREGYDFKIEENLGSLPVTLDTAADLADKDTSLSNDDKKSLVAVLDSLYEQGFYYYDRQSDVSNIWWKPWEVSVQSVNPEYPEFDEVIRQDTAILTSLSGGLRHIVTNIPILGQEFPTHQHLGSIEPYYNLEFHLMDDTHTLESIGEKGGVLTALRALMQHNSRKFRLIPDSWCILTDCFLTRLIGTLRIGDLQTQESEDDGILTDLILTRRTLISRAQVGTVEGNPGLSRLIFEMQETNPYTQEAIEAEAPKRIAVDTARERILKALYNLEFISEYKDLALKVLIAQVAGANTSLPGEPNFGKFTISKTLGDSYLSEGLGYVTSDVAYGTREMPFAVPGDASFDSQTVDASPIIKESYEKISGSYNTASRLQHGDEVVLDPVYVMHDQNKTIAETLRQLGIPVATVNGTGFVSDPVYTSFSEASVGLDKYVVERTDTVTVYDISPLLNASQDNLLLGEIPISKIQLLAGILRSIMTTADMYIAEDAALLESGSYSGSALTQAAVRQDMYNLPITPRLFRSFEWFLEETGAACYWPELNKIGFGVSPDTFSSGPAHIKSYQEQVSLAFENNPNWLVWSNSNRLHIPSLSGYDLTLGSIASLTASFLTFGRFGPLIADELARYWEQVKNAGRAFSAITSGNEPEIMSIWATFYNEASLDIADRIAGAYVEALPLKVLAASDTARGIIEDSLFGAIVGGLQGDDKLPAIANTRTNLTSAIVSSGNFGPHPWYYTFPYFLENAEQLLQPVQDIDLSVDAEGSPVLPSPNPQAPSIDYQTVPVPYSQAILDGTAFEGIPLYGRLFNGWSVEDLKETGIPLPGSPIKWVVDPGVEREKVRYLKQLLARLADAALQDPGVLKAFGLESLSWIDRRDIVRGKEAYPDLELPYHPYYGDTYSVYPDFYMWNMYEDGDVFNSASRQEVSAGINVILEKCFGSLRRLQTGETGATAYDPARDKMVADPAFDEAVTLNIKYNAEGSDGPAGNSVARGPMATPFYPNQDTVGAIESFWQEVEGGHKKDAEKASDLGTSDSETGEDEVDLRGYRTAMRATEATAGGIATENLRELNPPGIRLSNTEGEYGLGAGVQYPSRLSADQYRDLESKVKNIKQMFGSSSGFLPEKSELPQTIQDRIDGLPIRRDREPTHKFDLDALKQLAEVSSNDIFSQKRRVARAFPTFKLYFIEEDEWETRLLNFDDFYSYNGVKDFSVTISRKNPGDVAIVTLQNVSGVLDGTKRDAVVDLDYFTKKMGSKALGDNPTLANTIEDQPFGALVLRPGLNVQLRAGYANDPDNLSVLINGRVVDVQWNQQGDTAQIMIQSFGTELVQVLKGTEPTNERIYYTTHQLLGAMLLEPELMHFGRWEFGQLFQIGESKDASFDFFDYSKEAHFGRFEYATGAMKWFFRHPIVMYAIALGGIALASRLPGSGSLFARSSRFGMRFNFVNKMLGSTGILGRVGAQGFEQLLIKAAAARTTTSTLITAETLIPGTVAREVAEQAAASLTARAGLIGTKEAGNLLGRGIQETIALRSAFLRREIEDLARRGAGLVQPRQAAILLEEFEAGVATSVLRGQWMSRPFSTASGVEFLRDIGRKPLENVVRGGTTGVSKLLLGAAGVGLLADVAVMSGLPKSLYDATIGRVQRYFQATKVSIMLSPQDDNLYPPHPKDYMIIGQGLWPQFKNWLTYTIASTVTLSDELGNLAKHYFGDNDPLDKRAPVAAYQYKVTNSTIWDILHEMSLRHPGWIFGLRPYGKKFRYTLFFGVPSQRYWATPADNSFIERANKLVRLLENGVDIPEYRSLYGDTIDGIPLDAYDTRLQMEAELDTPSASTFPKFEMATNGTTSSGVVIVSGIKADQEGQRNVAYSEKLEALRAGTFTGRALQEYLRALNLRFIPFRRYHTISSEIDLVWNGIMGSENASYNAVDVTYFDEDPTSEASAKGMPIGSQVFKAHAFLPESMLRVKPQMPYPNCRGYNMAMRYGMGELLFTLRDMYRGEIITLGNPRIVPWDICILHDTYNSMVGPIEVEQVVHNFSHETGFITEIKPSAVVLANETSSWPLLEAMKLASLAVKNIENDALGITMDSFGTIGNVVNWIVDHGPGGDNPEYNDAAKAKMKEYFGDTWDEGLQTLNKDPSTLIFNGQVPDPAAAKRINDAVDGTLGIASGIVDTVAVLGGLTSVGLGYIALKRGIPIGSMGTKVLIPDTLLGNTIRNVTLGGSALGILASGSALASDALIDPPQLMSLLGGSILMLQCLRGDSIMVVPLMKNGYPVVSGLNYHDPTMIWKSFLGDLGRFVDDVFDGSRDLADLWSIYGMYAWRRIPDLSKISLTPDRQLSGVDMTGAP